MKSTARVISFILKTTVFYGKYFSFSVYISFHKHKYSATISRFNTLHLCYISATLMFVRGTPTNNGYFSKSRILQDDNLTTCVVFQPAIKAPWEIDFLLPISYFTSSPNVMVEFVGENLGCSSGDDGALYSFPISSWNESSGLIARRKTCIFNESSDAPATGQQRCVYKCTFSDDGIALRVIRLPRKQLHSSWTLCDVSNLFYGKANACRLLN